MTLDEAEALFKEEWHKADEEGDEGNRVRRGLTAVFDAQESQLARSLQAVGPDEFPEGYFRYLARLRLGREG